MIKLNPLTLKLDDEFDLLRLYSHQPDRYPFLLESVVHGTAQARFDILFAFPGQQIAAGQGDAFLSVLDDVWRRQRKPLETMADLPFHGGWFLYLGYELAAEIEPKLSLSAYTPLPAAFAVHMPAAIIRDHQQGCTYIVSEPGSEHLLKRIAGDINGLPANESGDILAPTVTGIEEDSPQAFTQGVERIRDYIREGDVFQVNLSRQWRVQVKHGDAELLYQRLRQHNPAPFAALVNYQGKQIISSSPERLVCVDQGSVSTRPIAGTRPRGDDQAADLAYSQTLMSHPKERAEHVMLIDLERNDLGRVCQPGSVAVDEMMVLESYAHVHHIVSNVIGELQPDVSPGDVIRAVFPGGTITGCPKVRCMEIIQELEQTARGPYTGSLGYLSHCGRMDLNILIRTMLLDGDTITFRTGAGIVHDSVAGNELHETRAKARGLLKALGL